MIDLKAFAEQYGGAQHPENEIRKEFDTLCQELRRLAEALKYYEDADGGPYAAGDSHTADGGVTASKALSEFSKAVKL